MPGFSLPLVNPAVAAPAASSMPSMPNLGTAAPAAPSPAMAAPLAPSAPTPQTPPQGGGGGLQDVLKQLLPLLVSGIAAKRGGPMAGNAVLTGYAQGLAKKHQDALEHQQMVAKLDASNLEAQQNAAKLTQERQYKLANFIETITKQVNDIDDPATFAATVELADKTAQDAFGAAPGTIKHTLVFNDSKRLAKEKKDAQALVDGFVRQHGAEALDQAIAAGAMVDGKRLADLVKLTQYDVTLPSGERFAAPKPDMIDPVDEKSYVAAAIAEARKVAKAANKPFTQSDAMAVSNKAREQFSGSKRSETDPITAEIRSLRLEQMKNAREALSPIQQITANRLADDYTRDSKDFIARANAYGTVLGAAKDPSPAGDLSLIFAYMKMLDPGSVVREGEFATAQNAAAVPDQIRNAYNKVTTGQRLNPKQRADFVATAQRIFGSSKQRQASIVNQYTNRAKMSGVPSEMVVMDFTQGIEPETPATLNPPATVATVRVRLADGRTGTMPASEPLPPGAVIIK